MFRQTIVFITFGEVVFHQTIVFITFGEIMSHQMGAARNAKHDVAAASGHPKRGAPGADREANHDVIPAHRVPPIWTPTTGYPFYAGTQKRGAPGAVLFTKPLFL